MGDNRGKRDPKDQTKKLFIGGLNYETTEEGLQAHFSNFGEISDVIVIKDPETKKSRGFGFVTYKEIAHVDEAQNNRPHEVEGKKVDTRRALSRDQRDNHEQQKMFVGGIPKDTSEDQIKEVFSQYGTVTDVAIIKDKSTQQPRGFGFVTFGDFDSVDKCLAYNMVLEEKKGPRNWDNSNKYKIEVNGKLVDIKKAENNDGKSSRTGGGNYGGYGGHGGYGMDMSYGGYDDYGYGAGGYGGGYGGHPGWHQGGFGENYGQEFGGGAMRGGGYGRGGGGGFNNRGPYRGGNRGGRR